MFTLEEVVLLLKEQSEHCYFLCESEVTTEDEGLNYPKYVDLYNENIEILLHNQNK